MTPEGPTKKQLIAGTLVALLIGSLVVTLGILPAEYGVDPTGFGAATGITKIKGIQSAGETPSETALTDPATGFTPTATATKPRFSITWATKTTPQGQEQGYLSQGEETKLTVSIQQPNVQLVTARIEWTDANETATQTTEPDIFEIQITAPDGRESSVVLGRNLEPGCPGNATATLAWRELPLAIEFEATDEAAAKNELTKRAIDDTSARGDWSVRVKLVQAGGVRPAAPAPLPVGVPTNSAPDDAGNDWNVTIETITYSPLLTQKATEPRTDETTLTVAPGQGYEFKLHMGAGLTLDYSWKADQPIYFDFHGEKDGDSGFTSHKKGTQADDAGNLTAPFTGKQGWYFENRNSASATVTLKTSGYYVVLGKK